MFLVNNAGLVFCLDATTGEEVWNTRLEGEFRATPLAAGGKVYFLGKNGKATIVEASRDLKIVGQADLGEEIIASPAVAGGNLYIRTKQHLYRIGK